MRHLVNAYEVEAGMV